MQARVIALLSLAVVAGLAQGVGCGGQTSSNAKQARVLSLAPLGKGGGPAEAFRLRFDLPVVEEAEVGKLQRARTVELEPETALTAIFEDRQTLIVRPESALAPSTTYRLLLQGSLRHRVHQREFAFVPRPLVLEAVLGVDPERTRRAPDFTVRFNQDVRHGDLMDTCTLVGNESGSAIELIAPTPDKVNTSVGLRVGSELEQGQAYTLECAGIIGYGGDAPLPLPFRLEIRTFPELKVVSFKPAGKDVWSDEVVVEVVFSNPVDEEQVRRHLSVAPAVKGFDEGALDASRTHYAVEVELSPETAYKVTLAKGVSDVNGQTLAEDAAFEFATGDARPRLSMETGIFSVEEAAKGYSVWTRNLARYEVECARVPEDRLVHLLTSAMSYDPWYDASENGPLDWKKLGLHMEKTVVRISEVQNKWHLEELALGKICGGDNKRGVFLAELRSDDLKLDQDHPWRYRPRQRVLANVTDLGLLLKAGSESSLLWVTRLSSGQTVADAAVRVYTPSGKQVWSGKTDKDGIARMPGADELLAKTKPAVETNEYEGGDGEWRGRRLIAVAEVDGDVAVIDGNWSNGIQRWNFGVNEDYAGGKVRIRGLVMSDRGIYRPGETVRFKGLARRIALGKLPAVPSGKVAVRVDDSRGAVVYERKLPLSRFGGFSFDLPLTAEAPLGDYTVTARLEGQTFRETFYVEEFRKVSFEVELDTGVAQAELGKRYEVKTSARYLFGAPVTSAEVRWNVMRRPHWLSFPGLAEFSFSDDAANGYAYWWWEPEENSYPAFISEDTGVTDVQGRLAFRFRDEDQKLTGPQDYLVNVEVQDATGESVAKRVAFTAHRSALYVGLHTQEYVQAVGMPFAVSTVAVDPSGKRVATQATLTLLRERSVCTYDGGYRAYPICETKHDKVWTRNVAIPATGMGSERIYPERPGEYVIRLETKDRAGNAVAASGYVWVLGKGEAFWSGDESVRMSVVASKQEYQPGETARLVPRTSLGAPLALVTIERSGILDAKVVKLGSSGEGVDVAVTEAMAPNAFASISVVQGRSAKGDRYRPKIQVGVVELKVKTAARKLEVAISTDKTTYEPGEKVSGKIRVTQGGQGVEAEVALSVADEGVLRLVNYKTPDPMSVFYAPYGLGIDYATTWNRVARLADPTTGDPDEGGDSGQAMSGRVRSKFVNSAFFAPALLTGKNGEVAFSFIAPDNLTAFRMMAVAADAGARFGASDGRLTITRPLIVRPLLPRFVNEGDELELGAEVRNLTGKAGRATVTIKASGLELKQTSRTVELKASGAATVRFKAKVGSAGTAVVTVGARLAGFDDTAELEVPVRRPLLIERTTIGAGEAKDTVTLPVRLPANALLSESQLEISIDRTGLADLGPALRYLISYPYGCLEQTLSRLIPLTKVRDLAASLSLDELKGGKLDEFIRLGVAKVLRHQHDDGNFSLWPGSTAYPHLTVYAVYGLGEAKRSGIAVDQGAIDKALAAIRAYVNGKEQRLDLPGEAGTAAMAAFVLADLGAPDHGLAARLFEVRRALPVYGRAFLLSALVMGKEPQGRIDTLTAELLAEIEVKGDRATVHEQAAGLDHYMSSDVRSAAIALSALLRAAPGNAVVPKLVAGLKDAAGARSTWYNTQDTIYALVALSDYARRMEQGSAEVEITQGGKRLAKQRLEGNRVLGLSKRLFELKSSDLVITTSTPVRYAVRLAATKRASELTALAQGFEVVRQYLDPTTKQPLTSARVGNLVRVRVTVQTQLGRDYVAVVDPLPAGLEPVNAGLATSVSDAENLGREDTRDWRFDFVELRDTEVRAFADHVEQGQTLVLEYLTRALTPGRFTAAAARAEAMYQPDIAGRTAATHFEVTK